MKEASLTRASQVLTERSTARIMPMEKMFTFIK